MRTLALCAAALVLMTGARAAAVDLSVAQEPPIELPKYEVVDTRILPLPEHWRYAEVPGFEILSNISQRETSRFLQDFVLLQEVIRTIMPALIAGRSDVPTAVVLTGRSKGHAEFLPADRRGEEFSGNSLFFENPERTAIVIDFALSEIELDNSTRLEADPYRSFYAEYFRFLLRRKMGRNSPRWLEEGLVQLFAGIDFNRKWINFGMIGDGFGGTKVGDFNQLLAERGLMSIGELLDTERNGRGVPLWRAQCYAFVHLCLYGYNGKYRKPFIQFVTRLDQEPLNEAMFRQCFNCSYKDMGIELRGYLQWTIHQYIQFRSKKGQQLPEPPTVRVRDATASEVGRIKGEVLRLGGHEEAAHLAMIAPYIRGEKDARLLAALGLDELSAGHEDRAGKFLEAAAKERVVRARAYLELARLRYKAALSEAGPEGKLSAKQLQSVLDPLVTAMRQPPPLVQSYELVNEVWAHSTATPNREQITPLLEGSRVFSTQPNLLASTILLASRSGFNAEAGALADWGVQVFGRDPAQRERFTLLSGAVRADTRPAVDQKK